MFQYIHDVNAKVEQGRRYLTDVVRLGLDIIDIKDGTDVKIGEEYKVTLFPVVQNGVQTITTVPVHPKKVGEQKEVPTYVVPTQLKILVRVDPKKADSETAGKNVRNWEEKTVEVRPIVEEQFKSHDKAVAYYEELAHQLSQGDEIRHYRGNNDLRNVYKSHNGRYPSF